MLNFSVDYLFSSAGKLQFYVEVGQKEKKDTPVGHSLALLPR